MSYVSVIYIYINKPRRHFVSLNFLKLISNLPVSDIVGLPHPRSGDSQGQETVLAPSADKQTRNYDTEYSNHHPSLSTLRSKGLCVCVCVYLLIY